MKRSFALLGIVMLNLIFLFSIDRYIDSETTNSSQSVSVKDNLLMLRNWVDGHFDSGIISMIELLVGVLVGVLVGTVVLHFYNKRHPTIENTETDSE